MVDIRILLGLATIALGILAQPVQPHEGLLPNSVPLLGQQPKIIQLVNADHRKAADWAGRDRKASTGPDNGFGDVPRRSVGVKTGTVEPQAYRRAEGAVQRKGHLVNVRRRRTGEPRVTDPGLPSRQTLTVDEMLHNIGMTRRDPGAVPIAEFLRTDQALLSHLRNSAQHTQQLAEIRRLYQPYQEANPLRGHNFDIQNPALVGDHVLESAARDRFRHIRPVLEYLIQRREALDLNDVKVAYLRAVKRRFAQTEALLTPTKDEIMHTVRQELSSLSQRSRSQRQLQVYLREAVTFVQSRLQLLHGHTRRLTHDLALVNYVEKELDHLFGGPAPVLHAGRHLFRRHVLRETVDEGTKETLDKRTSSPISAMTDQAHHRDKDMQEILDPIGMQLTDPLARPIAVWRLSEEPLLSRELVQDDLREGLLSQWLSYRERHQPMSLASYYLPEHVRLQPYLYSDEGRRFESARQVILSLLQDRTRLRLSSAAVDYLEALASRFGAIYELMQPFPSAFRALAGASPAQVAHQSPRAFLHELLLARNRRIQEQARRIRIDTFLLHAFEGEMDFFHGLPLH